MKPHHHLTSIKIGVFLLLATQFSTAFPFVERVSYSSSFLDSPDAADYLIYLPPDYEDSGRRYPTVFYLHGATDNMYTDTCQAGVLDRLIRAEEVNPMIIVYLNITSTGGYRDNGPGDMQESFIIEDIIPHIDSTYRTIGAPEGRALDGFSMGAAGTTRIGFAHPQHFTALMAWDGGITSGETVDLLEENISDIRGRISVKLYYRPPNGTPAVVEALERLDVDFENTEVNTSHVGVLGESGPSDRRVCNDPSRLTEGWKFFSGVLAGPIVSVSKDKMKPRQSIHFNKTRLIDSKIYTPSGKRVKINSLNQLPGRGLYIVKSENVSGQKKLMYID